MAGRRVRIGPPHVRQSGSAPERGVVGPPGNGTSGSGSSSTRRTCASGMGVQGNSPTSINPQDASFSRLVAGPARYLLLCLSRRVNRISRTLVRPVASPLGWVACEAALRSTGS